MRRRRQTEGVSHIIVEDSVVKKLEVTFATQINSFLVEIAFNQRRTTWNGHRLRCSDLLPELIRHLLSEESGWQMGGLSGRSQSPWREIDISLNLLFFKFLCSLMKILSCCLAQLPDLVPIASPNWLIMLTILVCFTFIHTPSLSYSAYAIFTQLLRKVHANSFLPTSFLLYSSYSSPNSTSNWKWFISE